MVAIVKYNAGNVQSVLHALHRLGTEAVVTDQPELLTTADKVIFPGVGEASTAMAYLRERGLDTVIKNLTQPVLGICLGQQLMCAHSEEGDTNCLGIFESSVKRFQLSDVQLKVPHMGWNATYANTEGSALWQGIEPGSYFYYVHSYYVPVVPETVATCQYGHDFSASLQKGNFYAAQFHPEKSADAGEQLLANFLKL